MHSDDISLYVIVTVLVTALIVAALLGLSGGHPVDITDSYQLPAELAGCKVYRLDGSGPERTLYVVVRDGRPVVTGCDDGGKNALKVEVATP